MSRNDYKLCSTCLARISRKYPKIIAGEKCSLCDNLLLHEDKIYQMIYNKIHKFNIEFNTFHISCQVKYEDLNRAEKKIHEEVNYKGNNGLRMLLLQIFQCAHVTENPILGVLSDGAGIK